MPYRVLIRPLLLCCTILASMPLRQASANELAPEQRRAIEDVIHDYLKQHPDVLIDALRGAEQNVKSSVRDTGEQTLLARRREVFEDPQTPVGGNPKGDVTLVEFFDYRCPYCKKVQLSLEKLVSEDPRLRIAYKEFPILGSVSVFAARAALAANRQGKYVRFHDAMMAATGNITDDTVYEVARSAGLDLARLKRDMAAPEITAVLRANRTLAEDLGIRGTPTFVIGDQLVPGALDLSSLEELIARVRRNDPKRQGTHVPQ